MFAGTVQPGEQFSFTGADGNATLSSEIRINVDGVEHTRIHTSCSQPVGPGLVSGDFLVVDGASRHGGPLCPLPPACGIAGAGVLKIDGRTVEWQLTNVGLETVTIESISLVWPQENGNLKKVKLDSKKIFEQERTPPATTIDSGWSGQAKDREIESDKTRKLKLEFVEDAKPGNEICDCCSGDSDGGSESDDGSDSDGDSDKAGEDAAVAEVGWIAQPGEAGSEPPSVVGDRPRWAGAVAGRLMEILLLRSAGRALGVGGWAVHGW